MRASLSLSPAPLLFAALVLAAARWQPAHAHFEDTLFDVTFPGFYPSATEHGTSLQIKTGEQESFECYFEEQPVTNKDNTKEVATVNPVDLISPSEPCLLLMESYWAYELCPHRHLRQFHVEKVSVDGLKREKTTEYYLGRALKPQSQALEPPVFTHRGRTLRFLSQVHGDGTPCDLTGQAREAEVRYVCGDGGLRFSVAETATCRYRAVVEVPALCAFAGYAAPRSQVQEIACMPRGSAAMPAAQGRMNEDMKMAEQLARASMEQPPVYVPLGEDEPEDRDAFGDAQQQLHQQMLQQQQQQQQGYAYQQQQQQHDDQHHQQQQQQQQQQQPSSQPPQRPVQAQVESSTVSMSKEGLRKLLRSHHCFSGGDGGWWQYEFCFGKHVRQLHRNPDGTVTEILLGTWDEGYHKEMFRSSGREARSRKSISHFFNKGDFCAEAGRPRTTQVKLTCSSRLSGGQIALSLSEPSTCQYVLSVYSALFCDLMDALDEDGLLPV